MMRFHCHIIHTHYQMAFTWLLNSLNCKPSSIKAPSLLFPRKPFKKKFPLPLSLLLSFSFFCSSHLCPIVVFVTVFPAPHVWLQMSPKSPDFSLLQSVFPSFFITVLSFFSNIHKILQVFAEIFCEM